jgi:hypothetical protein
MNRFKKIKITKQVYPLILLSSIKSKVLYKKVYPFILDKKEEKKLNNPKKINIPEY